MEYQYTKKVANTTFQIIVKIFENIISKKVLNNFFLNNVISPKHIGFLPNRSFCFQLLDRYTLSWCPF